MFVTLTVLLGGLVVLLVGAELLIRGAVRLAEAFRVSPLLIGLTFVGFGSSTPELVTSIQAAHEGSPGLAIGNIVGSNIFNILVILGMSAIVLPLPAGRTALARDCPMVIGTALLFTAIAWSGTFGHTAAVVLLFLLAGYVVIAWRQELALDAPADDSGSGRTTILLPMAAAVAGLAGIVFGAHLLVESSLELARLVGTSEAVIGLTIVAAGTSLPELATSTVAAFRRQGDLAIGNILGSNIYNVLGIGGITALIAPSAFPDHIATFDNYVMVLASVLLFVFLWTRRTLDRWEGAVLFGAYVAYTWMLLQT